MSVPNSVATEAQSRRKYEPPRLPADGIIDPQALFTQTGTTSTAPIELEIGAAGGAFLFERLAAAPEIRLLGLEIRLKAAALTVEKVQQRGYAERCVVFGDDARTVLGRFVPGALSAAFIHFPDPWWKKRHAKRRLTTPLVMSQLGAALRVGGELFIQTDVEERALAFLSAVEGSAHFDPWGAEPWVNENPYGARSLRERQAIRDGLPVFRLRFKKRPC